MHHVNTKKDALLPLIGRLYEEIRPIEIVHNLWAGPEDYRPRIERFHDAIRAYSSGESPYDRHSRLAIEKLAQDIDLLRMIQGNPFLALSDTPMQQGPGKNALVRRPGKGERAAATQEAREARQELAARYKQYAVLFVALLAETADMNHASRMEEQDRLVEELAQIRHGMDTRKSTVNLHQMVSQSVHDPHLAEILETLLPKGVTTLEAAALEIKQANKRIDHYQKRLDRMHMQWLSGQLAIYEEGKELVQQFMQRGLNMAGKFLQEAMQRGGAGQGRGF